MTMLICFICAVFTTIYSLNKLSTMALLNWLIFGGYFIGSVAIETTVASGFYVLGLVVGLELLLALSFPVIFLGVIMLEAVIPVCLCYKLCYQAYLNTLTEITEADLID